MRGGGRVVTVAGVVLALTFTATPAHADSKNRKIPTSTVVNTLPATPGFPFVYQGRTYVTDRNGQVVVPRLPRTVIPVVRPLKLVVPLPGGAESTFDRWYGLTSLNGQTGEVTAAMTTARPVSFSFSNQQDVRVPRHDLGDVQIKSSTGFMRSLLPTSESILLQATRVVRDNTGLVNKELYYSVQVVDVQGNNVVNRSQTKFFPSHVSMVSVPLLFFDASVRARDALFGFGVSGSLNVAYPNGYATALKLGPNGRVALPGLPRGQYHLSVTGPGVKLVQPVTMSRPQVVDLKIFTWIDLVTLAGLGLLVAIGLVAMGRRFHRRRLARQQAAPEPPSEQPPSLEELPPVEGIGRPIVLPDNEPEHLVFPEEVLVLAGTTPSQGVARSVPRVLPTVDLRPEAATLEETVPDPPPEPEPEPEPVPEPLPEPVPATEQVSQAGPPRVPLQLLITGTQIYGPFVIRASHPATGEEPQAVRYAEGTG